MRLKRCVVVSPGSLVHARAATSIFVLCCPGRQQLSLRLRRPFALAFPRRDASATVGHLAPKRKEQEEEEDNHGHRGEGTGTHTARRARRKTESGSAVIESL